MADENGDLDQRYSRAPLGASREDVWTKLSAEAEGIDTTLVMIVPDLDHEHPVMFFAADRSGNYEHMP